MGKREIGLRLNGVDRKLEVEALLVGSSGDDVAAEAGALAARLVDPPSTTHASSGYLRSLTGTLVRRAIERVR